MLSYCYVLQLATIIPFEILWERLWTRRCFQVSEGLDIHMNDVIGCDEAKLEVEQVFFIGLQHKWMNYIGVSFHHTASN